MAFPYASVPIPTFEVARKVPTFAVPKTFALVVITFGVPNPFETHTFPWTVKFALAAIPIPTFVAMKVTMFAVPKKFALFVITFGVQTLFETHAFPWTVIAFPVAKDPIPMLGVTRVRAFESPVMFDETETRFPP